MGNFRVVLHVLDEHQLLAKYSKCKFWLRSMLFIGHTISSEGIKVYPKKIEAVKNRPILLTPTDIRSFLGLAEYYRSFVVLRPLILL